jgi:hypothetical protein
MAKSCGKAKGFFGVIQRIYTIFAKSTKRWHILKDNISGLTLKSLSSTCWESHVDSVKAIRFQMDDIEKLYSKYLRLIKMIQYLVNLIP